MNRYLSTLSFGPIALVSLLAGCAVGPDYQRPALDLPQSYAQTAAAQHYALQKDIQNNWWTLFQSPALNTLIEQAWAANPGIEAAQASLRAAQENVYAQQGYFYPTVQAGYTPSRTKLAGNQGGNSPGVQGNGSVISTTQNTPASEGGTAPFNAPVIYNFHTAQLTVGYTPDVFGANRRQLESAQAQQRVQRFQLEAAYITLASNVVAAAFQDALLRRQIALVQETITANQNALTLAQRQLGAGYISRLDFTAQQGALAQSRQLLPPLQKQFEQNRDLLRVLAGIRADGAVPGFDLSTFQLPQDLPLTLPSHLVEQRPDVRAAEELLRSASAEVGIARAARLPQFSISGSAGGTASQFGQMFWNSGKFFELTASVTQSLFDGGTLKHREAAANESLRGAVATYRSTVAGAFQNVADVLHAIDTDAEALRSAADASAVARAALELTERQHAKGYQDRLALIAAEQNVRQAGITLAQAQASQLGDTAALFQALGGGWWNRNER
ncbi:efflux transporter outer membrane subunit [Duganella sp. CY15W]|uniref:efflux transporter outer membrane subunit n=1 Tax=Duganella sp. CY15W TaxID=2692172 RepID=UPI00136F434C|nr:efflux transporter outer membrane subunit [Duganella sp. CY15W]MYM32402.1 efflux transporter outer membrane subunit [Duganella sp. CY15W]